MTSSTCSYAPGLRPHHSPEGVLTQRDWGVMSKHLKPPGQVDAAGGVIQVDAAGGGGAEGTDMRYWCRSDGETGNVSALNRRWLKRWAGADGAAAMTEVDEFGLLLQYQSSRSSAARSRSSTERPRPRQMNLQPVIDRRGQAAQWLYNQLPGEISALLCIDSLLPEEHRHPDECLLTRGHT